VSGEDNNSRGVWCTIFAPQNPLARRDPQNLPRWKVDGTSFIIEQRSVLHVLLAATRGRMNTTILWATIRAIVTKTGHSCMYGIVPGIMYGNISQGQSIRYNKYALMEPWNMAMASQGPAEIDSPFNWFTRLYMRTDISDEDKIWEAVMGVGNMWVAYRPDRLVLHVP
jgi:hypothetical protein